MQTFKLLMGRPDQYKILEMQMNELVESGHELYDVKLTNSAVLIFMRTAPESKSDATGDSFIKRAFLDPNARRGIEEVMITTFEEMKAKGDIE